MKCFATCDMGKENVAVWDQQPKFNHTTGSYEGNDSDLLFIVSMSRFNKKFPLQIAPGSMVIFNMDLKNKLEDS